MTKINMLAAVKNKRSKAVLFLLVLTMLIALVSCSKQDGEQKGQDQDQLEKIVLALDWTANTNHSGLFLAEEQGFFAREGLTVEFQESDMNFIEMVASGTASFGIASQEQILQARSSFAKIPVVAVAAILQHNSSGFASPRDRKITSPKDFAHKTYSGWGTELELAFIKTLMEKEGANFEQVKIINQSATNFIASMEMEADFGWIYWGWDGINCEISAYPIDFILLQSIDPRLDFYSPLLFTSEELILENPDLIKRFLRAAKDGYLLAIAEPNLAVEAILQVAPELDRAILEASQHWINEKYIDDALRWGEMQDEIWLDFSAWMKEYNILEQDIDANEAYSNEFLP